MHAFTQLTSSRTILASSNCEVAIADSMSASSMNVRSFCCSTASSTSFCACASKTLLTCTKPKSSGATCSWKHHNISELVTQHTVGFVETGPPSATIECRMPYRDRETCGMYLSLHTACHTGRTLHNPRDLEGARVRKSSKKTLG